MMTQKKQKVTTNMVLERIMDETLNVIKMSRREMLEEYITLWERYKGTIDE